MTAKKLIEVALPLPEINDASAYDKMPGIGPHPKGIHQWWARLPLPTSRAILFASVVDDPSSHPEKWRTAEAQDAERERLFEIIRLLMGKKLHERADIYEKARTEMLANTGGKLPVVFDPFSGGGSIPLEASRMGFETYAGDLNPVAVLLNKCNLEIAPRWIGRPPVNPRDREQIAGAAAWRGNHGLAADVRYYATLIREMAQRRLGDRYPRVRLPKTHGGGDAPVIAWIWARTVVSPDPAARGAHVPLVSTYWLASKKGSEAWLEPKVDRARNAWRYEVRGGPPPDRNAVSMGSKAGRAVFRCLLTNTAIDNKYINEQANRGGLRFRLLATVAEGKRERVYVGADQNQEDAAMISAAPDVLLESAKGTFAGNAVGLPYGFKQFRDYYTLRQLRTLTLLSDLVREIRESISRDASAAGLPPTEGECYAKDIVTFLGLALDRASDFNNSLCRWSSSNQKVMNLFGRQAIPMVWDFAEANLLGDGVGSWNTCSDYVADCIQVIASGAVGHGRAQQLDAASELGTERGLLISTDPPYYDNISYGALSDFFYVWLRRTIGDLYPDLFSTVLVPKLPELTASPDREADKHAAKEHFEKGFRRAFTALRERMDRGFPLTVYYAFKQDDEDSGGESDTDNNVSLDRTTGWETLLEALTASGFQITATWPVRASQKWRMISMGTNALASYIVLACRPRSSEANQSDRRSFIAELKRELPAALRHMQQGNIAPVDFAQAAIGPGIAIYSRYSRILESSGKPLPVRSALYLINQILTEVLAEQEDEFDSETRWAISWFDQHGFEEGDYGDAELLSKAKVTSVSGLQHAGLIHSKRSKVRLLRPDELPADWDPADGRVTVWGIAHHLIRIYFYDQAGDEATADLLRRIGARAEIARDLAYRLFDICERKRRSTEAQAYNSLALGWPEIARLARALTPTRSDQTALFETET